MRRFSKEQVDEMAGLLREGETLLSLGAKYGVSREYIRLVCEAYGYSPGDIYAARLAERQQEKLYAQFVALADKATPCVVCGCWVIRRTRAGKKHTCSHECAEAWPKLRFIIDPEAHRKHRVACAVAVLNHPEKYDEVRLRHARRVVAGEELEQRGRWHIPGSEASRMAAELVPALLPPPSQASEPGVHRNQRFLNGKMYLRVWVNRTLGERITASATERGLSRSRLVGEILAASPLLAPARPDPLES